MALPTFVRNVYLYGHLLDEVCLCRVDPADGLGLGLQGGLQSDLVVLSPFRSHHHLAQHGAAGADLLGQEPGNKKKVV